MGHGQDTGFYSICDEKPLENMKEENISFQRSFSSCFAENTQVCGKSRRKTAC